MSASLTLQIVEANRIEEELSATRRKVVCLDRTGARFREAAE